jgi:hypothetical protein
LADMSDRKTRLSAPYRLEYTWGRSTIQKPVQNRMVTRSHSVASRPPLEPM